MAERTTQSPLYSRVFAQAIVAAYKTRPAAALANALSIHLWKDPAFIPNLDTVLADFTAAECDYTDYAAAAAVVLTVPGNLSPDVVAAIANVIFAPTIAVVTGNNVLGYWLESGTDWLMCERFSVDNIVSIAVLGDFLDLLVEMPIPYMPPTV